MTSPSCDDCGSNKDVTPVTDPWGGVHGHRCENCHEAAYDRYMEHAMSEPTYEERWRHEAEQAQRLKR